MQGSSHRGNARRVRKPKRTPNPQQQAAINWNEEPALVSAGPGSGKTWVIIMRIARMIADGVDPRSILATTFTKKAAGEMNERLKAQGVDTRDMSVQTMHSFCYRMLKNETYRNWNLDDEDKYNLLIKIATGFRGMKWSNVDITLVGGFISLCKNSLIRPEDSDQAPFLKSDPFFGDRRYPHAYFEVEELRRQRRLFTFDDMLIDGVELLQKDRRIRERMQSKYEWVIVDEFQDSNLAQIKLVELVSAPQWNLMCVGDVDQCHPPGTRILTDIGYKAIETLTEADTVKGWNRKAQKMIGGRKIRIGKRHFRGNLAVLDVEGRRIEMTPEHKVLARWSDPSDRKTCVVYLMYREDRGYRIGWCQLISNTTNTFHLKQRARIEKAEKVWILSHTQNRTDASVLESILSVRYGIPTTTFEPVDGAKHLTEESITTIFDHVGEHSIKGSHKALDDHGLDPELPLLPWPRQTVDGKTDEDVSFRRSTIFPVYANNVIPGLMKLPLPDDRNTWGEVEEFKWRYYVGPVYSLDVEKDHSYAADGVVVLNCIYEWRGAVPAYMTNFETTFTEMPEPHVISMGTNYRSAPNIVNAAAACIANNEARITKELSAHKTAEAIIQAKQLVDLDEEANYVADEVESLHGGDGVPHESMFVLYRTNAQSRAIEEVFSKRKIPHVVLGSASFYQRKEVQDLLSYLKLMLNPNDLEAGERAINRPFRYISKAVVGDIVTEAERTGMSFLDAADKISRRTGNARIEQFLDAIGTLEKQYEDADEDETMSWSVGALLSTLVSETSYLDYLNANEGSDTMENSREANVGELIRSADRYKDIQEFLKFVDWQIAERKKRKRNKNSVTCMTIHRAKGLEARAVFMIGVNDGILPHARAKHPCEEERRLFYVGMTRAMEFLFISAIQQLGMESSTFLSVSQFIDEAGLELTQYQPDGELFDNLTEHEQAQKELILAIEKTEIDAFEDAQIAALSEVNCDELAIEEAINESHRIGKHFGEAVAAYDESMVEGDDFGCDDDIDF